MAIPRPPAPAVSALVHAGPHDAPAFAGLGAALDAGGGPAVELCVATPAPAAVAPAPGVSVVAIAPDAGRAAAYRAALGVARAPAVVLFAPGDRLAAGALAAALACLGADPALALVYGDEDRVDARGVRHTPFLRPDWSPEYLLDALYVDRAFVARRAAVEAVGGFRDGFDPVPEWDLVLRLAERPGAVARVADVLLHRPGERGDPWRPADAALVEAGRRAVEDACRRRGLGATVAPLAVPGTYRVRPARPAASVSVVVPFRDGAVLLARCVDAVLARAGDVPLEVALVDNGSVEEETAAVVRRLAGDPRVRVVAAPGPFNFAALVNRAAAETTGDVLCLLNNDVEPLEDDFLAPLLEHALRPDVGVVGARLLYPDGSIQHAGVLLGVGGRPGHAYRFAPGDHPGYFANAAVVREVSAVTGAALATRRAVFRAVGGFEEALPVAYNDVDYCLRVWAAGLRVLYTPHAVLRHHEGASRGRRDTAREATAWMERRWGARFVHDPYYHPRLLRTSEAFEPGPPPARPALRDRLARQAARAAWLGRDVVAAVRGGRRTPARSVLTFVAAAPLATPGAANRYWIRVHNPLPERAQVVVRLRGRLESDGRARAIDATVTRALDPGARADLTCETDWEGRTALGDGRPRVAGVATGSGDGTCEVHISAEAGGVRDAATVVQRVGG